MSTTFEILTYISWVALVFMVWRTVKDRAMLSKERIVVRISFAVLMLYSVGVRTFVYQSGMQKAPVWFPVGVDVLFIVLCLALAFSAWSKE